MRPITLAGGWGYGNIGDEAILAGYLEYFHERREVVVTSSHPDATLRAQRRSPNVVGEGWRHRSDLLMICGGGYLNGRWWPEIHRKLWVLNAMAKGDVGAHAIEVRRIEGALQPRLFRSIFDSAAVSVRDAESAHEVERLMGTERCSTVLPDAISLLVPHLDRYGSAVPEIEGKILLNLLDVPGRIDQSECELDTTGWSRYVGSLFDQLGDTAVGLIGGAGDREYMRRLLPGLPLLEPVSVAGMVSTIRSARGIVSVRMHPALIASGLGTPVVAIPYCGKVRPTLQRIGIAEILLDELSVEKTLSLLSQKSAHSTAWATAYQQSAGWIDEFLRHDE